VAALSEDPGRRALCTVARSGGHVPQPGPSASTAAPEAPTHQVKVSLAAAGPALVPIHCTSLFFECEMSPGHSALCTCCACPLSCECFLALRGHRSAVPAAHSSILYLLQCPALCRLRAGSPA
jgi:hypothetical protein